MIDSFLSSSKLSLYALLFFTIFSSFVNAQDAEKKALAKAQFLLKQVNAEKTQLQQQLQALQQEFDDYKKTAKGKISNLSSRQQKTVSTLNKWQESHGNLKDTLQQRTIAHTLEKRRGEELLDIIVKQSDNFFICRQNNQELAKVNNELLNRYYKDNKRGLSLTGLSKVKAQNVIQDYQHKIDDLELRKNNYLLKSVPAVPKPISDMVTTQVQTNL